MEVERTSTKRRFWLLLLFSTFGIVIVMFFWQNSLAIFEFLELPGLNNPDIFKAIFYGIGTVILGLSPAIVLWYFRDETKQIDQNHTERDLRVKEGDLKVKERDIKIKEDNDVWANFIKYQEMAECESIPESRRAAAVFALGEYYEYYRRENSPYPELVNLFFREYLDEFWKKEKYEKCNYYLQSLENYLIACDVEKDKIKIFPLGDELGYSRKIFFEAIPVNIKTVHKVIKEKSKITFRINSVEYNLFSEQNGLSLEKFNLTGANLAGVNLTNTCLKETCLKAANLSEANLRGAILCRADLNGANLNEADLYGANLNGANLYSGNPDEADLNENTIATCRLSGAKYGSRATDFPYGFDPKKEGMIDISQVPDDKQK